jgi:hypothetical protein
VDRLRADDIIAWLVPAGSTSRDTGHSLIVREIPSPRTGHPGECVVPIIDATATPTEGSDSRTAAGATGLGTGAIARVTDASWAPAADRWTSAGTKAPVATSIALGHEP